MKTFRAVSLGLLIAVAATGIGVKEAALAAPAKKAGSAAAARKTGSGVVSRKTGSNDIVSRKTGSENAAEAKKTDRGEVQIGLRVPVWSPLFAQFPVALVNDAPITMNDMTNALATSHEDRNTGKSHTGKINYVKILDRLINIKLVNQEAANIGLDETPEYLDMVKKFSNQTEAAILVDQVTKDAKADPAAVEKHYKEMIEEWKIRSLVFDKEADAKIFSDAVKAGTSVEDAAKKVIDDKKAKGPEQGNYVKPGSLQPPIRAGLASMPVGSVSSLIAFQTGKNKGFMLLKLEDKRYPENPELKGQAEREVLESKKGEMLQEYKASLYKKYVKIDEKLLAKLDYDSPKADIEKLYQDPRVVAEIKGAQKTTITIATITETLGMKFYHGLAEAAKEKRANQYKRVALEKLIDAELIKNEAAARGIDKSEELTKRVEEYKNDTLFGLFVDQVVVPDIKMKQEEVKAYFEAHKAEYRYPEMMKMSSLLFEDESDAKAAITRLKKGADIDWVRANADGIAKTSTDGMGPFDSRVFTTKDLSIEMQQAVAGARAGDFRLYPDPEHKIFYVLAILEVIPAKQQPIEDVWDLISRKAYDEKISRSLDDWFAKLRKAGDVKIYLTEAGK